jgi:hypothetical protein
MMIKSPFSSLGSPFSLLTSLTKKNLYCLSQMDGVTIEWSLTGVCMEGMHCNRDRQEATITNLVVIDGVVFCT